MEESKNESKKIIIYYGIAIFNDNKIRVLKTPSKNSDIIEDNSVINPVFFDKIIQFPNIKYISYITISGIRRYSLLEENMIGKAIFKPMEKEIYKWCIFGIYKNHYIDNYKPEEKTNKKSLSIFIDTLHINIQPKPLGLCAQFVHWALNVAGFKFQGKFSAKLYHLEGLLNDLGFHEIPQNSEFKKGDIIVFAINELINMPDYYGHICVWDGEFWLCDGKEKTITNINKSHLYRYDSWDE